MRGAAILLTMLVLSAAWAVPVHASTWEPSVALAGVPFGGAGQIAINDDGEVVTVLTRDSAEPRLDWRSADGALQLPQPRGGTLGAAADGTMFLVRGDADHVYVATKPPGLAVGPDVPVADGRGGGPMDVNSAGDIVLVLGDDLGLLERGAASATRIEVPPSVSGRFTDLELTDGGEILAARLTGTTREVVIVPPGGEPRVESLAGSGCDLQIAAGPDGRAIATWESPANEYSCGGGGNHVALRPAGGSFGAATAVPGVPWQSAAKVAVDHAGRALLAYDSSYPNGVTPNVILLTAGPADTTWATSTTVLGYLDGLAASATGAWLAYGAGFIGPHTARVGAGGVLEDIQDVIADCQSSAVAFGVAPGGRAAMLGWHYGRQEYAIARQVTGTAPTSTCGRPVEAAPETPQPPSPRPTTPLPLPPTPRAKPAPATAVKVAVRRASRRRVTARFTRSTAGRLITNGTLRVAGHRAIKAKTSGSATTTLTFRVPARTWRTLARKGARLTLTATSPEGGRWTFKRTLRR